MERDTTGKRKKNVLPVMFWTTQIEMFDFVLRQSSKHIVEYVKRPFSVSTMYDSTFL